MFFLGGGGGDISTTGMFCLVNRNIVIRFLLSIERNQSLYKSALCSIMCQSISMPVNSRGWDRKGQMRRGQMSRFKES